MNEAAFRTEPAAVHPFAIHEHELLCPIASGAYGEVWSARNAVGTLRAVKIVRRDRHATAESFEREFKGLQKFEPVSRSHEGFVDILTLGLLPENSGFYYVMELADGVGSPSSEARSPKEARNPKTDGQVCKSDVRTSDFGPPSDFGLRPSDFYSPRTLRADLKSCGALPADEVIALGLKLTAALAYLHAHGLVHRDVKPSNILFIDGEPKLADAGLVAAMDDARSLVGTAGYIAPEGPGTPQADLYALGKVLYEAAFGKDRQEFPALPADVASRPDHARLTRTQCDPAKACATDRRERYQSADQMRADLELPRAGRSVKRRQAWHEARLFVLKITAAFAVMTAAWFVFSRFNSSTVQPAASATPGSETFENSSTTNCEAFNLYLLGRKGSTDLTTNGHEPTRRSGPDALISLVFIRVHWWLRRFSSVSLAAECRRGKRADRGFASLPGFPRFSPASRQRFSFWSAAVRRAPAAARRLEETVWYLQCCCGWSGRHNRAPGQNENCWHQGMPGRFLFG